MTQLSFVVHHSTFKYQNKNYSLLTADIFADLLNQLHFKSQCENAITAMHSYPLSNLGKTNIKVNGNIFLLLINTQKNLILLLSQNAIYETCNHINDMKSLIVNNPVFKEELNIIQDYKKIPDIFLIYPNATELNQIELSNDAKIKFLKYKEEITSRIKNYRPSLFERFNNFVLGLICDYQTLRTQLLKFIAVVPALTSDKSGKTLKSSFIETAGNIASSKEDLPFYIQPLFQMAKLITPIIPGKFFKVLIEFNISFIARRFICTEDKNGASNIIKGLHSTKRNCTFDQLGELVICQTEADEYCQKITDLINSPNLFESGEKLNKAGIPSHHISIKTSALTPHFNEDPDTFEFVYKDIQPRLLKLFSAAIQNNVFLNFDAEHYHYRDLTVKLIFHFLHLHKEFNSFHYFGFVLQAYLKDSHTHFNFLYQKAEKRKHLIPIRLVKGAYWDAETVEAKAKNFDSPQFLNKEETDIQYRHLVHLILKHDKVLQLSIASHNVDDHCYAEAVRDTYYPHAPVIEHQTLHMTYEPLSMAVAHFGWPMRNYLPTGSLLVGMGYLVRRIMENASQTGVLTATRHHHFTKDYQSLIEGLLTKIKNNQYQVDPATNVAKTPFMPNNSSHLFIDEEYSAFTEAKIDSYLTQNSNAEDAIPIYSKYSSNNLLGKIHFQGADDAKIAVERANLAKSKWAQTPHQQRASFLQKAAQIMRLEKFELSKLIMEEAGKTRLEALGDVDEAIDFLNYYASEILKDPAIYKRPLGVFAIISPWNFPLAILCGMTAAALAAGNTVIMKPAEQTPLTAMAFYQILLKAKIPDDVIQILIGNGETVGASLVENINVNGIAFTGSKQVGVNIYRRSLLLAIENKIPPRNVITEMGGKNALIICKDAELDQAISSSIYSAFAHAGQKCSACSRVLVHVSIIEQFTKRFTARASEIMVGSPDLAETFINPLISKKEKEKSLSNAKKMNELSNKYNEKVLLNKVQQKGDSLIGPFVIQINANSLNDTTHPVYHEMFAPLIYIIPFETNEQAVAIFNNTNYALTGGVFTQSDLTIQFFLSRLKAGNLYFNRNITGARVAIEPFGGFYLSGTGPKAGGASYLNAFQKYSNQKDGENDIDSKLGNIKKVVEISEKITPSTNQIQFDQQKFRQWYRAFGTELLHENLEIESLFTIPGQTTYLDYQIKKEEVIFVLYELNILNTIYILMYYCKVFNINFKIFCLSQYAFQRLQGSTLESSIISLSKKDFLEFPFSTNLDLVIHNNDPEINNLILKVFSEEKYYQKKMLKMLSLDESYESNKIKEFVKLLCEPRTIAINTMRYGAPLEESE